MTGVWSADWAVNGEVSFSFDGRPVDALLTDDADAARTLATQVNAGAAALSGSVADRMRLVDLLGAYRSSTLSPQGARLVEREIVRLMDRLQLDRVVTS